MASQQFEKFKKTLQEVFMLDQAELDFGIYRIMNQKRKDIDKYLDEDLVKQVQTVISENASGKSKEIEKQIEEATAQAHALGIDPNALPKIKELKDQLAIFGSAEDMENEVYSHLATFYSRYYEGGDFISQRRYKKDVYAIPYEGEEVKLHWANADQYYIKTSEYFRTYSFKTNSGKKVEFTLKDATVEQNNNKAQGDQERRFAIFTEEPIVENEGVLHINFTYELTPKKTRQTDLISKAFDLIKPLITGEHADYIELLTTLCPTEKNSKRTLLEKHLNDYVARNTFDYFIHKDLHGFLSRELDFYIKNEILFIDDINAKNDTEFLQHLTVIKAVKAIGGKIIDFLSSLENFQKKLWMKKKFVVESNYCITLDRIPEEFYEEIASNDAQREEWVKLFAIDLIKGAVPAVGGLFGLSKGTVGYSNPLSTEFLMQNPYLLVDTKFYPADFKHRLLSEIPKLDEQTDGLMISSENFQALNLLQEKYKQQISCIYIDPPYNSPSSEIAYKNYFKHSSWLSLMSNRLLMGKELLSPIGSQVIAIDKYEHGRLYMQVEEYFSEYDVVSVGIEHNKKGNMGDHFSYNNEYAIFAVPYTRKHLNELVRSESDWEWSKFRNWGSESERTDAKNCFYPVYIRDNQIIGYGEVCEDTFHPKSNELISGTLNYYDYNGHKQSIESKGEIIAIYPIDVQGIERKWRYAFQTMPEIIGRLRIKNTGGIYDIEMPKFSDQFKTLWYDSKYNAGDNGTKVLTGMGISKELFQFPKSVYTTRDCVYAVSDANDVVLDYFAGSGTTGHAIISLNRKEDATDWRKYILVEMGDYFETVTKPRIQKVIYSEDWKDGKPVSRKGISHCMKYIRLEQYEDTLNNLIIKDESRLWAGDGQFNNSYMLGYMLDTETKDSLFNLKWFENPFEVSLKVTRNNEMKEQKIDMVDTFNYLIGLNVASISYPKKGICTVEGVTRRGEKTLVIWRDCTKVDNAALESFFSKSAYSTKGDEFDRIYINGDNNLENLRTSEEHWKVVLTEEEFSKRMFEE